MRLDASRWRLPTGLQLPVDLGLAAIFGSATAWQFGTLDKPISPGGYELVPAHWAHLYLAVILACLPLLLPTLLRRSAWLVLAAALSALTVVDTLYIRYFDAIPPVRALFYGAQTVGVKQSVVALWHPTDVILIWDAVFLLVALPLLAYWLPARKLAWPVRAGALALVVAASVQWGLVINDFDRQYPRALATDWNPRYIATCIGVFSYHLVDLYNTALAPTGPPVAAKDVEAMAGFLDKRPSTTALAPGANVIIIQIEALQQFTLGLKVKGQALTPNLDRFIKGSLYFPNIYGQTGDGNTADAEFMTNTSFYPLDRGAAFVCYPHNVYDSLPKRLAAHGYHSTAMHANVPGFWNRYLMYPTLGYGDFESANSYVLDEQVGPGLSDKSFLRQSLVKLEKLPTPFHTTLVTLSSHHPYNDVAHFGPFPVGAPYEGTMVGNYLKSVHYVDAQLGMFLAGLAKDGLLDKSVVVMYGDHPAIARADFPTLAKLTGVDPKSRLAWVKLQKIPLIIHVPHATLTGIQPQIGGQIDIMPTTLHLVGVSARGSFGRDLLGGRASRAILHDGSLIQDGTYFDAGERKAYDLVTEKPKPGVAVEQPLACASKSLGYSNAIVKQDLVPRLNLAWQSRDALEKARTTVTQCLLNQ